MRKKERLPPKTEQLWRRWEEKQREFGHRFVVVDCELEDVTPKMIDWWWSNMDKGYVLWEPKAHKVFQWTIPPGTDSPVGSIHYVEEIIGGKILKASIKREDPNLSPIPKIYKHATLAIVLSPEDKPVRYILHQYEAASYGTRMRSTFLDVDPAIPWDPEAIIEHCKREMTRLPEFLPQLYKLWQAVDDPAINRQFSFEIKRRA